MHEYSLAESLLAMVERETRARGAIGVRRVEVRIGAASGIECALFATAFEALRTSISPCRSAELTIEQVDAVWSCPGCARVVPPGERLICPACGAPARLVSGDELMLDRIELEVDDV